MPFKPCYGQISLKQSLSPQAEVINALCEDLDFVWRAQHPTDKEYSYFSEVHKCYTRKDYFFTPKTLLQSIINSSIGNVIVSNHAAVFVQFDLKNPLTQRRHWMFSPLILKDHKFISYFKEEFESSSLLWEKCIAFSRGLIISYTSSRF